MPDVKLVNLTKRYGDIVAANQVSIQIRDGEYVSFIGPSGCGKTTVLRCIAGIAEPDEGEIYIGEKLVTYLPPEERGIGYVFQNILLFPHIDVWDNIVYGPKVKGWEEDRMRTVAHEILDIMKLSLRADAYPDELSMGMQQKVALARALSSGVGLLLLDEPLSALDVRVRTQLRFELRRMVKELKLTAIHVTHDQEEAMSISDRLIVMRKGSVEQVGTPVELYSRPKTLFVAKFIGGECNFIEGVVDNIKQRYSKVKLKGEVTIKTRDISKSSGERVVAAVKPEHVLLLNDDEKEGIPGRIMAFGYLGDITHFEIELVNGEYLISKAPKKYIRRFKRGDSLKVHIKPENVLLFPYPEEGLVKATEIE
ncbi:MAG: ATP-binding cassette domain-containing protein [Nitrososphaeria archaeon]|nr:ATP-binding cassette domain-containing protein [Nitrososphaeria archaeon]NIQ33377.1 ATP-binding cassette domain-containing protein [Nitrososphaeria archaeon]